MHIKDFAAQTGLSTDTLRYYEKEGLLQPARDANGYRNYGTRDVDWITFILRLKAMGVPLARIKEYAWATAPFPPVTRSSPLIKKYLPPNSRNSPLTKHISRKNWHTTAPSCTKTTASPKIASHPLSATEQP